jgi:Na+:H+ antiporter, NhaA family
MKPSRLQRLQNLVSSGTFPGLLLLVAAVIAFVWANTGWLSAYEAMKHAPLPLGFLNLNFDLELWVNDLLMAVFFLLVGLELKREVLRGELSNPRGAALAVFAAIGGMLLPAALYAAFNAGGAGARGWGVPMATDIAFALGVLTVLGNRVPNALRLFLTALAVVDDLGAILVIAVFYTSSLDVTMLGLALGVYGVLWVVNLFKVRRLTPYLLLGAVLWYFVYKSGLHATIAGVLLATTIPLGRDDVRPLETLEHRMQPFVTLFILPVFALFNAGVPISAALSGGVSAVSTGVFAGLVFGKPLGITLFSWIAVRCNIAELPPGVTWRMIFGVGCLGGIGFTMALFIANLAFAGNPALEGAKLGILGASLIAAVIGLTWLRVATRPTLEIPA